eukprot:CAMPEP_0194205528 /NCGR_PEP_ID=MMETSP0156-20130528/4774_1 /TAXON_ID=33649 /ORGANISM="Thalassionema nitzschioides, Strain L26-B" /LENGTH=1402 /DNA_ID=CAMNT_0038931819 /DNA_START=177 /DNA_END=4385 /DNA_ORIENTATION=+
MNASSEAQAEKDFTEKNSKNVIQSDKFGDALESITELSPLESIETDLDGIVSVVPTSNNLKHTSGTLRRKVATVRESDVSKSRCTDVEEVSPSSAGCGSPRQDNEQDATICLDDLSTNDSPRRSVVWGEKEVYASNENGHQLESEHATATSCNSEFRTIERLTAICATNSEGISTSQNRQITDFLPAGKSFESLETVEKDDDSFEAEERFRNEVKGRSFRLTTTSEKDENPTMFLEDFGHEETNPDELGISMESKRGLHRILGNKFRPNVIQTENNILMEEDTLESDRNLKIRLPRGIRSRRDDKNNNRSLSNQPLEKKHKFFSRETARLTVGYESSESEEEEGSIHDSDGEEARIRLEGEATKASWVTALKDDKKTAMFLEDFEHEGLALDEGGIMLSKKGLHRIFGSKFRPVQSQSEHNVLLEDETFESDKSLKIRLPRGLRSRKEERYSNRTPTKERVAEKIQHLRRRIKRGKTRDDKTRVGESSESIWDFEQLSGCESEYETGLFISKSSDSWSDFNASNPSISTTPLGDYSYTASTKDDVFRSQLRSEREIRVKPYHRFLPHKVYMTEEELYQNMKRPSQRIEYLQSSMKPWFGGRKEELMETRINYWGNSEDGRIGSLLIEVLSCTGVSKTRSDISVCLVCGDAAFETDVIQGCRSPMWPSMAERAACFPLFHAYARLFVGVFDVKKKTENDIFCGRTTIDISSLRPRTQYDLSLPLRASTFVYDRRPRGTVRLRFSLHWFSERAAVLSYLKSPQMLHSPSIMEQPSILCDDPKTFRNIAVTIHGQHLPGKYSRVAFRATMREFNLYQLNIRFLLQSSLRSAVLYERPMISLYIFATWMHCVINLSIRLVPVYFIGLLIFLLIGSYFHFALSPTRTLGFKRLSLQELGLALIETNKSRHSMGTLSIEKEAKSDYEELKTNYKIIDHGEFPFSSGEKYKRLTSTEAVIRKNRSSRQGKSKREEMQLQKRLSVYSPQDDDGESEVECSESIDPSTVERQLDSDAESEIIGDADNVYGVDSDDSVDANGDRKFNSQGSMAWSSTRSMQSSVVLGPAQNNDEKPKKQIPPQIHLARLEDNLNKLTQSLSMDGLLGTSLAYRRHDEESEKFKSVHGGTRPKKSRRIPLDDFDKRLGYRVRHPNPVTEITSSFLGPLMRIFRIFCAVTRALFNISAWTDPYLSFWVLCFLIILMLVLLIFPWQLFFCILGIAAFGPQNIMIRRHLRHLELMQQAADSDNIQDEKIGPFRRLNNSLVSLKERRHKKDTHDFREGKRILPHNSTTSETKSSSQIPEKRRKFKAVQGSRKFADPREIIVPYSRIRMERFSNWPPDPTVARATPIPSNLNFSNRDRTLSSSLIERSSVQSSPSNLRRRIVSCSSFTEKSAQQSNTPNSNRDRILSY